MQPVQRFRKKEVRCLQRERVGVTTIPLLIAVADNVIVAVGVLLLVGAVVITSIVRYEADDFVKFWAAAGTVIGLALGGVGTFFFTKGKVDEKESQLKTVQLALSTSEKEKLELGKQASLLVDLVTISNPWAADKLKYISETLKGEKPIKFDLFNGPRGSTATTTTTTSGEFTTPQPLASPTPTVTVSPSEHPQPNAETTKSPGG
jgi:hypothetical protein